MPNRLVLQLFLALLSVQLAITCVFADVAQPAVDSAADSMLQAMLHGKPAPVADGDELERLLAERYNSSLLEFNSRYALLDGGKGTVGELLQAARRYFDASRKLIPDPTKGPPESSQLLRNMRRAATMHQEVAQKHLDVAREIEQFAQKKYALGLLSVADVEEAKQWRLELQIEHLELKKTSQRLGVKE
jgi:hypothetical protein